MRNISGMRAIDAGLHHRPHALLVGLGFVLPAELRKQRRAADVDGGLADPAVADLGERAQRHEAAADALRLLHLLHRMAPRHVADLVGEHAGQLVHRRGAGNEAAVHVHPAAGTAKAFTSLLSTTAKCQVRPRVSVTAASELPSALT